MTKATQDQPTAARRLTTAEAALLLGRSPETVLHMGMTGRLARERGERRSWTYAEADVLALKATLADPEGRMTTAACARHLGLSVKTVLRLARLGTIPSIPGRKGPGGGRTFKRGDVERYAAKQHAFMRMDVLAQNQHDRRELERLIAGQQPVPSTNAPGQRFVLPDVMRNWPILDERDRAPGPPSYGSYAD
ncbi:helix-turn-helix domain-containing protein [Burkholderia sp. 1B3(2022)]|uniref:helix-turn-helix domain-containing protein n=1 Tax=Burkholderia sp. 1B3(2022) TaxID=2997425 RepID=UPI002FC69BFB